MQKSICTYTHSYSEFTALHQDIQHYLCSENSLCLSHHFLCYVIWNELPATIRESNTLDTFKRRLKTHLTSLTTRNV